MVTGEITREGKPVKISSNDLVAVYFALTGPSILQANGNSLKNR
jgi:hypothetical protein